MRHRLGYGIDADTGFRMRGEYPERPTCAIGFQIDTRDQPVSKQKWQHIVSVQAARGGRVDLDPIAEAKDSFSARTLPDKRVERREQSVRIELGRRVRITR